MLSSQTVFPHFTLWFVFSRNLLLSIFFFFFFIDPAPPEISPLPLHAALPFLPADGLRRALGVAAGGAGDRDRERAVATASTNRLRQDRAGIAAGGLDGANAADRHRTGIA